MMTSPDIHKCFLAGALSKKWMTGGVFHKCRFHHNNGRCYLHNGNGQFIRIVNDLSLTHLLIQKNTTRSRNLEARTGRPLKKP